MKIKPDTAGLAKRYQRALHRYLREASPASLKPALRLGQASVGLGLETLGLALIHKNALAAFEPAEKSARARKLRNEQAQRFFDETAVPIEKTHGASLKSAAQVQRVAQTLQRRKAESTASALLLERSVIKRQKAEKALGVSGDQRLKLAKESNHLHALLREKTRAILVEQELKRKKNSLQLQDQVAQALLAIDIRLLGLKKSAESDRRKFAKDLDETQRMVRKSLTKIKGVRL